MPVMLEDHGEIKPIGMQDNVGGRMQSEETRKRTEMWRERMQRRKTID